MKSHLLLLFFTILTHIAVGQNCNLTITGKIIDTHDDAPLEFASVLLEEAGIGEISDVDGNFVLHNICPGNYHLRVSHLGCETSRMYFTLERDTTLTIYMEHHTYVLNQVNITSSANTINSNKASVTLSSKELESAAGKTFGEITKLIAGVSSIRSGSVFKPVIHGMYGNRVSILNNGIVQNGQQWGLDHAPEIDPFAAQNIQVVKGAATVRYGGNNLGGVILMNPAFPSDDPHIHGNIQHIFDSNGFGNTLAATIEQATKPFTWRVTSSYKKRGDLKTPNYYLNNTGVEELNLAVDIHKTFNTRLKTENYYSIFNSKNGILRGAHIGNVTDLRLALEREVPFFTEDEFSYDIEEPYQKVQHHLFKTKWQYLISDNNYLDFVYAFQWNARKEFDVRRGGRSEKPAMDLHLFQHYAELHYKYFWEKNAIESGVQLAISDNTNTPGTGIEPLIPNYIAVTPSMFGIYNYTGNKISFEAGGRYDFRYFDVVRLNQSNIERNSHNFHNITADAGATYNLGENAMVNFNASYTFRSPEVNELYSMGLHQGVASIEEGNPNLKQEKGFKALLNFKWQLPEIFTFDIATYYQRIDNYIYLIPEPDFRLTIRGAFPVFTYRQNDATIYGMDIFGGVNLNEKLQWQPKYSIIRGKNTETGEWMIRMPSDNLSNTLSYENNLPGKFKEFKLSATHNYIWEQTRFNPIEELAPPPPGYHLFDLNFYTTVQLGKKEFTLGVSSENIFNNQYRDYLDRLRFFADAPGRNTRIHLKYEF